MGPRSILEFIRHEWRVATPMGRIAHFAMVLGIVVGLGTLVDWTLRLRSTWNAPRVRAPLRSEIPEYFDVDDLSRYEKWGIDRKTAEKVAALLRTRNQLDDARDLLLKLRSRAPQEATDFINGLITATWYGEENHRQGLEFLGEVTRNLPLADFRYRFQFHAHLRAVAVGQSIEEAEKLLDHMRRNFHRVEYSRVWLGIPLPNMEALRRGVDAWNGGPAELGDSDREYLEKLVKEIPEDPFIDHALYFLGDYEPIIEEHPKSLIRSTAMQLWIFECVDCRLEPSACRVPDARVRLAKFAAAYPELLPKTRIHAATLLASAGRVHDAEELGCGGTSHCFGSREAILDSIIESARASAADVIAWLARADPHLLERRLDSIIIKLDEALDRAENVDYAGAVEILERCGQVMAQNGVTPSARFLRRLAAFTEAGARVGRERRRRSVRARAGGGRRGDDR